MENDIYQNSSPKPPPIKKIDNSELLKSGFWISQVFMIIATIAGVYFAAQQGLSQALTFDSLKSKELNYHLQRSLHSEINDNIKTLNEYAEFIVKTRLHSLKQHKPQISEFVWDNMKFSSNTLETPSHLLTSARRFYDRSKNLVAKIENKLYGRKYGAKLLNKLTETMAQDDLIQLEKNYQQLELELKAAGFNL